MQCSAGNAPGTGPYQEQRRINPMANSKGIFITLAAVVVAGALGYFAGKGGTSVPAGTEGTIGAADRYTSTQINPGDVTVADPEVQAFMESDLFRQMQGDAQFQTLVTTGRLETLLRDAEFSRRLTGATARDAEARRAVQGGVKEAEGTAKDAEGTAKDAEGSKTTMGTAKDAEGSKTTMGTAKDAEGRKVISGTAKSTEGTAKGTEGTAKDAEGTQKNVK